MLGTLIKSQILENIYGIKFVITFVVCVILVLGATITGIGRFENQLVEDNKIININKGNVEEANSWDQVGHDGVKQIKPASSMSIFASGLDDSVGRTATVHEWDFPHMEDSVYSTAPIFAVFGDLDLTFIIKIVVSLFAILFTYNLISGEKESGTLKLCLSNSVPRNTFILGKSIGSFVSLLIPLLIPLIIGLIAVLTIGNISFTGDQWGRIALIALGYVLYLLAFFCLGVFVSALTRHSAVSFLILLFLWVLFVLVIPKASMMAAGQIHPIQGITDVQDAQLSIQREYMGSLRDRVMEGFRQLAAQGADRSNWRTFAFQLRAQARDELEPEFKNKNEKLINGFKKQQINLTNLATTISRISPASAVTYIGMNLAGTGFQDQENFINQITKYRTDFAGFIRTETDKQGSFMFHGAEAQGQLDVNDLPPFEYQPLSFGESVLIVLPDMMMMAIVSIIFYALAFVLFIRYDVR